MQATYLFVFGILLASCKWCWSISIIVQPAAVDTVSKSSVYVSCSVQPSTGIRVFWRKEDVEFPPYPSGSVKVKDSPYVFPNNTLYIASVKRRHTGEYQCVAFSQSTGEKTYKSVVISIKFMEQIDPIEPVKVFEGLTAEIICVAPRANPMASVSWLFNGTAIPKSDRIKQNSWTLSFTKVEASDNGTYTCVASNEVKSRTMDAKLQVYIPGNVVVTPKRDQIKEGEMSSFTCLSQAKPPLPTEWKHVINVCKPNKCTKVDEVIVPTQDGRITIDNGKLTIRDAIPDDKGVYKCEASLGSQFDAMAANLNVIEKIKEDPKSHDRDQACDIREKKATIHCKFRGDGTYEVTWNRVNATQPLPDRMVANRSTLVIHNVTFEDSGVYRCTAKGEFNTGLADVNLQVYESSIFKTTPKNVSVPEGKSIWVDCLGEGVPQPKVSYHKNGQPWELNATIFKQLPNDTLFINSVKKEYAGKYHCWLTQDGRIRSQEFYLEVQDGVPVSKSDASPMGRTVGIAVGCAGVYILLVIGLMIYCRARRARLLKQGLITEIEDGDLKDPLFPNDDIPLHNTKNLDDWQYPREKLKNIVTLGHGKMGRVFQATAPEIVDGIPESLVAVKQFDGSSDVVKQDFDLEVEMFVQLRHENVVKLMGVSSLYTPYFLIIEMGPLGNLKEFLEANSLSLSSKLNMAKSIASGMEYMVSLRYIHRDLSARNCVVFGEPSTDEYNVKISFLSLCEDIFKADYFLLNDIPVPLRWLSPEAIMNESYSEKSDVWSYGVTMWEIFSSGKRPYENIDNDGVKNGVCKNLRLQSPDECPSNIFDVMSSCWENDPKDRPTFKELLAKISAIELDDSK